MTSFTPYSCSLHFFFFLLLMIFKLNWKQLLTKEVGRCHPKTGLVFRQHSVIGLCSLLK